MKIVFALALLAIVSALALAGRSMLKGGSDKSKGKGMANALALRVALSVALFLFILLSHKMGWINPTGIPMGQ